MAIVNEYSTIRLILIYRPSEDGRLNRPIGTTVSVQAVSKSACRSDFRENTETCLQSGFDPGMSRAAGNRATSRPLRPVYQQKTDFPCSKCSNFRSAEGKGKQVLQFENFPDAQYIGVLSRTGRRGEKNYAKRSSEFASDDDEDDDDLEAHRFRRKQQRTEKGEKSAITLRKCTESGAR